MPLFCEILNLKTSQIRLGCRNRAVAQNSTQSHDRTTPLHERAGEGVPEVMGMDMFTAYASNRAAGFDVSIGVAICDARVGPGAEEKSCLDLLRVGPQVSTQFRREGQSASFSTFAKNG